MPGKALGIAAIAGALVSLIVVWAAGSGADGPTNMAKLPSPDTQGKMTLEKAMAGRRSVREFTGARLSQQQISQLCWAAQGVTDDKGHRTCPSAMATYPLEIYVATADGVMHYLPATHSLEEHRKDDRRPALKAATGGQLAVGAAPAVFVITAVVERTAKRCGDRAERMVLIEVGHCAQNLLLQAAAMGLGAVPVGGGEPEQLAKAVDLPDGCKAMYMVPVGVPGKSSQ